MVRVRGGGLGDPLSRCSLTPGRASRAGRIRRRRGFSAGLAAEQATRCLGVYLHGGSGGAAGDGEFVALAEESRKLAGVDATGRLGVCLLWQGK